MPGRYYPSNPHPRHGGSGSNQRGGVPTNINVPDQQQHVDPTGGGQQQQQSAHQLSPEALALTRLRQKSISHPMQQCQLAIYVPPHTVGAVIGRGGRTILSVQREAMRRSGGHLAPVRISVLGGSSSNNNATNNTNTNAKEEIVNDAPREDSFAAPSQSRQGGQQSSGSTWNYQEYQQQQQQQQTKDDSNNTTAADDSLEAEDEDEWTPVLIRGDPVGCFAAVRQILPLVDRDHDPDIVFEVPIHRAKHNMLVGKGGIVLAALSATHETRIMIPPNEFMSNVGGGGENFWKQREKAQSDVGNAMLFGDGGGNGMNNPSGSNNPAAAHSTMGLGGTALPPNVIQLEGDIDNVERCLVKMLTIVSGERWVPTGKIVEKAEVTIKPKKSLTNSNKADDSSSVPPASGKDKDETTAEAVIVKIWTPSSKLLNLGKIRKVQRKTNTVIRRKKLRFTEKIASIHGGANLVSEKIEEELEEDSGLGNDDDGEDEMPIKEVSIAGPKTATKYIITGRTESVRSAAAQFEKILGLEPGSSAIIDTTHKTKNSININKDTDVGGNANNISNKDNINNLQPTGSNNKAEGGESDGGPGGPGGKKVRRKKKRGKGNGPNAPKGAKDGASPNNSTVEKSDA